MFFQEFILILISSVSTYIIGILFMKSYKSRHLCIGLKPVFSRIFLLNKNNQYINGFILIMQVFLIVTVFVSLTLYITGFLDFKNIRLIKTIWFYFVLYGYGFITLKAVVFAK